MPACLPACHLPAWVGQLPGWLLTIGHKRHFTHGCWCWKLFMLVLIDIDQLANVPSGLSAWIAVHEFVKDAALGKVSLTGVGKLCMSLQGQRHTLGTGDGI